VGSEIPLGISVTRSRAGSKRNNALFTRTFEERFLNSIPHCQIGGLNLQETFASSAIQDGS